MRRFSFLRSSTSLVLSALLLAPVGTFAAPKDKDTTDTKDTSSDSKKKGSKNDPDDIGDRNVSGKVNFYSLREGNRARQAASPASSAAIEGHQ